MQQASNTPEGNPRRGFIKSAAGLLFSAPLFYSLMSCGRTGGSNKNATGGQSADCCPNAPSGEVSVAGTCLGEFGQTHEPPVGGGGGSFYIELNGQLVPPSRVGSYDIYAKKQTGYSRIASIKIITELRHQDENEHVTDVEYIPWPETEFWVWLAQAGAPSVDCPDVSAPDVKFICNSGRFEIHVANANSDALNYEPTFKNSVPYRYEHTGRVLGDHFRIAKWAIVDSGTHRPVDFLDACDESIHRPGCSSGEDSYRFYLLLGDPTFVQRSYRYRS